MTCLRNAFFVHLVFAGALDQEVQSATVCGQVRSSGDRVLYKGAYHTIACSGAAHAWDGKDVVGFCQEGSSLGVDWSMCGSTLADGCGESSKLWFAHCSAVEFEEPPTATSTQTTTDVTVTATGTTTTTTTDSGTSTTTATGTTITSTTRTATGTTITSATHSTTATSTTNLSIEDRWVLGLAGQPCDNTCSLWGLKCDPEGASSLTSCEAWQEAHAQAEDAWTGWNPDGNYYPAECHEARSDRGAPAIDLTGRILWWDNSTGRKNDCSQWGNFRRSLCSCVVDVPTPAPAPPAPAAQWALGGLGASCDSTCSGLGMFCDPLGGTALTSCRAWKRANRQAENAWTGGSPSLSCKEARGEAGVPAVTKRGKILWWDRLSGSSTDCSGSHRNRRPLCSCMRPILPPVVPTPTPPPTPAPPSSWSWVLGKRGASCHNTCNVRRMVCDPVPGARLTSCEAWKKANSQAEDAWTGTGSLMHKCRKAKSSDGAPAIAYDGRIMWWDWSSGGPETDCTGSIGYQRPLCACTAPATSGQAAALEPTAPAGAATPAPAPPRRLRSSGEPQATSWHWGLSFPVVR